MLSLEDFKTCVDKLPQETQIRFSGWGEPALNPAFTDMVLYAHSTGHPIRLNTTLVGMTKENYEKIRDIPLVDRVIHIPDRDGNSHFELTEQYLELLDLLLCDTAAGRFRINFYSCHGSVHPVVAGIFKKNGLPVPAGTTFKNLHDRAGNIKGEEIKHSKYKKGQIWCSINRDLNLGVLLPDGTIALCCMDMGMEYILGNLLTQSYAQVMQGDVLCKVRRCIKSEKAGDCLCRHCSYAKTGFEYFIKTPLQRKIRLIRRKIELWTRIRRQ